ncbi:hypothetical protein ACFQ08_31950, partial [Streptosporangium algeriense]
MERRALFHHALLGSRFVMNGRLLAEVERTRQELDRTLARATVTEDQLDALDEQVLRYRREYITSAPLPMLYRLMLELCDVRALVTARQPAMAQRRLLSATVTLVTAHTPSATTGYGPSATTPTTGASRAAANSHPVSSSWDMATTASSPASSADAQGGTGERAADRRIQLVMTPTLSRTKGTAEPDEGDDAGGQHREVRQGRDRRPGDQRDRVVEQLQVGEVPPAPGERAEQAGKEDQQDEREQPGQQPREEPPRRPGGEPP